MNILEKIWNLWDSTSGRVMSIVGSISLILSAVAFIIGIIYLIIHEPDINCLKTDIDLVELQTCAQKVRGTVDEESLYKKWIGRRVQWKAKINQIMPSDPSNLLVKTTDDVTQFHVNALVGPWGENAVFWCVSSFTDKELARSYISLVNKLEKNSSVKLSGIIKKMEFSKITVKHCLVVKE